MDLFFSSQKIVFFYLQFLIFIAHFFYLFCDHKIRHLSEAKIVWCRDSLFLFFFVLNCYMLGNRILKRNDTKLCLYTQNKKKLPKKVSELETTNKKMNECRPKKLRVMRMRFRKQLNSYTICLQTYNPKVMTKRLCFERSN